MQVDSERVCPTFDTIRGSVTVYKVKFGDGGTTVKIGNIIGFIIACAIGGVVIYYQDVPVFGIGLTDLVIQMFVVLQLVAIVFLFVTTKRKLKDGTADTLFSALFYASFITSILGFSMIVAISMTVSFIQTHVTPDLALMVPADGMNTDHILWMTIDQMLKGALFDSLEVFELSVTPVKPNPEVWWFAGFFVLLRIFVSVYVLGTLMQVFSPLQKLFGFTRR